MKLLWAQIFFLLFCLAEFRRGVKRQGRGGGRTENGKKKNKKKRQKEDEFSYCSKKGKEEEVSVIVLPQMV